MELLSTQLQNTNQPIAGTPVESKPQKPSQQLMNILKQTTVVELVSKQNETLDLVFVGVQRDISLKTVQECPKVYEVIKRIGRDQALKIVIVALVAFQNSLKIQNGMTMAQIIEASEMWLDKFTHESIQDLILALRLAKEDGKIFYNKFSVTDLFEITKNYLSEKWDIQDAEQRAKKSQENRLPTGQEQTIERYEKSTSISSQ